MRFFYLLVVGSTVALVESAAAGEAAGLRRCVELESDVDRLECYDAALREQAAEPLREQQLSMQETAEPSAAKPAPARAPASPLEPVPPAVARFGLDAPAETVPPEQVKELGASITAIEVRRNGERVFTLDNGQVWAEKSPSPSLHLEVGDRVTIRSGLFGSHRLFGSGKRSSGVDRVR